MDDPAFYACILSLLAGLSTSVGGIIVVLAGKPRQRFLDFSMGLAAGVMTYVTADELIPTAHAHGHEHAVAIGLIAGFTLMLLLTGFFEL